MILTNREGHDYEDDDAYRFASKLRWTVGRRSWSRPFSIGERRHATGIAGRSRARRGACRDTLSDHRCGGGAPMWLSMIFRGAADYKAYRRATWQTARRSGAVRAR
jgi:hypothetical protein